MVGWAYWLPFEWAGKAGGREWVNSRKRRGPSFGRAALPQRAVSDFRLWLCEPRAAIPVPAARFHRESAHSQVQAACGGLFWGGNELRLSFRTHFYRPVMSTMLENGICGMHFKKCPAGIGPFLCL